MAIILDPVVNFGKVTVSIGYDDTATAITLTAGHGALLPDPSSLGDYNLVWWDSSAYPDPADDPKKEIVRVTANAADVLTVTRAQEGTAGQTKNTGGSVYKMILGATKKTMDDIQTGINCTNVPFTNQTSVTVTHSLGYYPLVQVVDDLGNVFVPDINHSSTSAFTVTFAEATTGNIIY